VKENVDYHQHFQTFYVNFRKDSTVSVDGNEVEAHELYDFLKEYTAFSGQGKRILIYLNFDEDLSFDNYLSKVIWLKELEHETCTIAPTHFIYNLKKLPDCNCTL
jgi:biopolymer transport protein ExbD